MSTGQELLLEDPTRLLNVFLAMEASPPECAIPLTVTIKTSLMECLVRFPFLAFSVNEPLPLSFCPFFSSNIWFLFAVPDPLSSSPRADPYSSTADISWTPTTNCIFANVYIQIGTFSVSLNNGLGLRLTTNSITALNVVFSIELFVTLNLLFAISFSFASSLFP